MAATTHKRDDELIAILGEATNAPKWWDGARITTLICFLLLVGVAFYTNTYQSFVGFLGLIEAGERFWGGTWQLGLRATFFIWLLLAGISNGFIWYGYFNWRSHTRGCGALLAGILLGLLWIAAHAFDNADGASGFYTYFLDLDVAKLNTPLAIASIAENIMADDLCEAGAFILWRRLRAAPPKKGAK